ncbi:ribosylnicotinamide kinase [Pichia californica]|uniref:Ribosylnicotinamide kinase n=1 Tax=Pichia californica TaxID=460514 RepID=A0A9P6WMD9_9ASCO|nr:ribosylnicotinamide kinase [[Candida] californica]
MRTILIGITGASSSGKSTLACLLQKILPSTEIIHEDDFFKQEKDVPFDPIREDRDWDCPDAIDIDAMKQTLRVLSDPTKYSNNPKAVVKKTDKGYYDYGMTSTEPPKNDANFKNNEDIISNLKDIVNKRLLNSDHEQFRIFLLDGFLVLPDIELLNMFAFTLFFKTNYQSLKGRRQIRLYTVEGNVWLDPPGYFDKFVWPGYYTYHKDLFVNGEDESYVKDTGGILKKEIMKKYNVYEFDNNDDCDADNLIKNVLTLVINKLF